MGGEQGRVGDTWVICGLPSHMPGRGACFVGSRASPRRARLGTAVVAAASALCCQVRRSEAGRGFITWGTPPRRVAPNLPRAANA